MKRFWGRVSKTDNCWQWSGAPTNWGYGRVYTQGKYWLAHRLAWVLSGNDLAAADCLLHSCDNRLCVNPAHLRLGTRAENQADMKAKGRGRGPTKCGEKHKNARFSTEHIVMMRALRARGWTSSRIARTFETTATVVLNIVTYKSRKLG